MTPPEAGPQCFKGQVLGNMGSAPLSRRRSPRRSGCVSRAARGGYSGLKFSLVAPQMGQVQEAGRASHLVPGFTPLSGSPSAGSYT